MRIIRISVGAATVGAIFGGVVERDRWEGPYLFFTTGKASWKNMLRGCEGGGEEQSVYARFWLGEILCIPHLLTGPPKEIHQR